jgi:iron complex outermembrane receptor protein
MTSSLETIACVRTFTLSFSRHQTLATVSVAALMLTGAASPAFAQAAAQTTQPSEVEEVIVTGTRIVRDGYEAPTPLTVVGVEQVQQSATNNTIDYLTTLPAFAGNYTPQNSTQNVSAGTAGTSSVNLRNLGTNRTLVLINGQRSVPSTITGLVDVNTIPSQLIERVDVVTGGASSAYGSDAVAGVVNFVLDNKFTGVKGEVSGGVTTYGDDRSWKVALTAGTAFANDRGHFLFSGEINRIDGIPDLTNRGWNQSGAVIINNPTYTATNGQPRQLKLLNGGLSTGSPGGIITNTALRGIEFGPGGVPRQFNYGSLVSDPWVIGGDWNSSRSDNFVTLDSPASRQSLFTRASYDLTDDINVYVQLAWNHANVYSVDGRQFNVANLTVKADNPFLPATVAAQMTALKLTQFTLGSMNADIGVFGTLNDRITNRYVVGGSGRFDALDTAWTWDAYYQRGNTHSSERATNTTQKDKFSAAIDPVRNAGGQIVCRVNADAITTNDAPGCVPWNLMGIGVNSQAALNYILGGNSMAKPGQPQRVQSFVQDVMAANVNAASRSQVMGGAGIRWRSASNTAARSVFGVADRPMTCANNFFVGNFLRQRRLMWTVTEGFRRNRVSAGQGCGVGEGAGPQCSRPRHRLQRVGVCHHLEGGRNLYADRRYPHFRATRSRDIRAPNLNDLFAAGTANTNNVLDPFNGNGLALSNTRASPSAIRRWCRKRPTPRALGVVLQPRFFPGFNASVDYYNIDISGAIGSVAAQSIVDQCYAGNTTYCAAITRGIQNGVNVITQIRLQPFNFISQTARGLDFESSYRLPLSNIHADLDGNVTLRFLATHFLKNYTNNGQSLPTDTVGQNAANGPPKWRYNGSIAYSNDPFSVNLTVRGLSAGTYNNSWIVCKSGCPASTTDHITVDDNSIAGAMYLDLGMTYRFSHKDADGVDADAFFNVKNLTNKDPVPVYQGPGGTAYLTMNANPTLYDVLGRVFRAGIRFNFGGAR